MTIKLYLQNVVRLCAYAACALLPAFGSMAWAAPEKTLHEFCHQANCPDGEAPYFGLTEDSSGTLYGTTYAGGLNGAGTVFSLTPSGGKFSYKRLYSFCAKTACHDGGLPQSNLIVDVAGNLYGTTTSLGAFSGGTVYELKPNAAHTKWNLVILYSFCSQTDCTDGKVPAASLTYQGAESGTAYDGTSVLYGTTTQGGTGAGGTRAGVAYELTFQSGKTLRAEQVLYNFCSQTNCTDGNDPWGLTIDGHGTLYGTTQSGGQNDKGAVYEIVPKQQVEFVLYSFCPATNCPDGWNPITPLVMDANGNLYGTARGGGAAGWGVVFKIVPNGVASQETVLHSFCRKANCTDGALPSAGVVIDPQGAMFGTTLIGGFYAGSNCETNIGCGTVYRLQGTTYAVLHSFCKLGSANCPDGREPLHASLLLDGSGNLFGTTSEGGYYAAGTVFMITP